MHDLEIRWPAGQARFSADDSPVLVGRSPDAAVILTDPSVSRRHIEFLWSGSGWTAVDSSTHGSFDPIGVRLRPEWRVGTDTVIRLGGPEGIEVQIFLVTTRPGQPADPLLTPAGISGPPPDRADDPAGVGSTPARHPRSTLGAASAPSSLFGSPPPSQSRQSPDPSAGAPNVATADPPTPEPAPAGPTPEPAPAGPTPEPAPAGPTPEPARSVPTPEAAPAWSGEHVVDPRPPSRAQGGLLSSPSWSGDRFAPDHLAADPDGFEAWLDPSPTGVEPTAAPTVVNDDALQLSIDGRDYTFVPGTVVTVGRDPASLVRVDERHALVSRRHLTISYRDGGWWIDDTSTKGTFVGGRRLTAPHRAQGAFMATLGHVDAGLSMRIITAGQHRARPQSNLPLVVVITVLTLLAVIALVIALTNRGNASAAGLSSAAPGHQVLAEGG